MFTQLLENFANNKEITFKVRVKAGTGKNDIKGQDETGRFKIDIKAPAQDNKANLELIKFLATELGLRRYQVQIIRGLSSSYKTIKISR